ncbi:MAG: hypothetical protein JSS83_25925 [Cyanobacteria bacterium SZAS LIN-3]|nr:hypothetical protein [Cyanobacteria bacterium SZAS LIN-3]
MQKDYSSLPLAKSRYVACLDILGITEAVNGPGLVEIAQLYQKALDLTFNTHQMDVLYTTVGLPDLQVQEKYFGHIEHVAIFSDSVMVFTDDLSINAFYEICHFSNTVFKFFLHHGLPLRGGIAHGETIVAPASNVFLGKGIVNAYKLEKSFDSLGVIVSPDIPKFPRGTSTSVSSVIRKHALGGTYPELMEVPVVGWNLDKVSESEWIDAFKDLRNAAGPKLLKRYKNSELIVGHMLGIDAARLK